MKSENENLCRCNDNIDIVNIMLWSGSTNAEEWYEFITEDLK